MQKIPLLLTIAVLIGLSGWQADAQATTEEGRAVWINAKMFSKDRDEALDEMQYYYDEWASLGINHLYVFDSNYLDDWDILEVMLDQAHSRNMNFHSIYCPYRRVSLDGEIGDNLDWLIQGVEGHRCLNMAIPEVREFMLREMTDLLEYDIDGIQFDGIRFPVRQGYSYDARTRAMFEEEYGRDPLSISYHNSVSLMCGEWVRWNANHITNFLRETQGLLEQTGNEDIVISVAVFPEADSAAYMIGQDWRTWAVEGLVDVLCPMLYTNHMELFRKYTSMAVEIADGNCLMYAGLSCRTSHDDNTPEGLVEQVEIARELGADGVVFFMGTSLLDDYDDALKATVFAD